MFIKTDDKSLLNTNSFAVFYILETETGSHINAAFAAFLEKEDRKRYDKKIITCANKEDAQKALNSICKFIEYGENIWDAGKYKKDPDGYKVQKLKSTPSTTATALTSGQ